MTMHVGGKRFASTPEEYILIARSRVDFVQREWRILESLIEQALDAVQKQIGVNPNQAVEGGQLLEHWAGGKAELLIRLQLMVNMLEVGNRNLALMATELDQHIPRGT